MAKGIKAMSEINKRKLEFDRAGSGPARSRSSAAGGGQRWDWQTFSGDLADIWDHSASCDICGHVFRRAETGPRR
jgi:hypothetical protein